MNWRGQKVLVTGAGGFIGSHLAEELVRQGADVRAMVLYNSLGNRDWLDTSDLVDDMEIFPGDVSDHNLVTKAVDGIDYVFHLAALIAIPYSYHAPLSYVRTNIEGTLNILQASSKADVKRIVHTSTSEVYGTAQYVPIDESHPLQGQSPYSASKIGADKIVESFHLSFGLPVVTVRPFNTYGPRQSARAVIPTIITQCLGKKIIRLGNLNPTRDLTFVEDTVSGFLAAATTDKAIGMTINLGSGAEISIGDLALKIINLCGSNNTLETEDKRLRPPASEVERLISDNSKARELVGWTPSVDLKDGLQQTIDWFRQNQDKYHPGEYTL